MQLILVFATALAVSALVTPLVRRIAVKSGLLDRAHDSRKQHERPVPRLGGIGIVAGVFVGALAGSVFPPVSQAFAAELPRFLGLAAASVAIAALGLFDDLGGADAKQKFSVQVAVAVTLYAVGYRIEAVSHPFGATVALGWTSLPLTLLWIVGVCNGMNLIDGLDGLAGGVTLVAAVALFSMTASAGDLAAMVLCIALVGAIAGFLAYNVNPASIFMGDTGSLFLGMLVSAVALHARGDSATSVPLPALIVVLAIPIADTSLAFLRRAVRGVPVFSADREHLHHRLLALGLPHRTAVVVLWLAGALLAAAGVHMATGAYPSSVALVVLAAATFALDRTGMLDLARPAGARHRVNRLRFQAVRAACRRLRAAPTLADVQSEIMRAAPALAAEALCVRVAGVPADGPRSRAEGDRVQVGTRFALDRSDPALGALDVRWGSAAPEIDRDIEVAFELLCRDAALAVTRVRRTRDAASMHRPDASRVTLQQ